ncbi:cuticle collagen 145, partial [Biomphalaria pfeifferi]
VKKLCQKMDDLQKEYNYEPTTTTKKIRDNSMKVYIRGLYVLLACLTIAFSLTFLVCYVKMIHLRTTLGQMQTLGYIAARNQDPLKPAQPGLSLEETKSKGESNLSRTKRESLTCNNIIHTCKRSIKKGMYRFFV